MANLYLDERLGPVRAGALVEVTGDEARHAVRVSRLRVGEETLLGNGAGLLLGGVVESVGRDSFAVRIGSVAEVPAPTRRLVLVQALAKGDRDERAVEQATEFGVDAIAPWQAARSVSRWDGQGGAEKTARGIAKWARIAREASKQSMRAWVPEVRDPLALADLCALAAEAHVIALHPRGGASLSAWAARAGREADRGAGDPDAGGTGLVGTSDGGSPADGRDVYLVVGPEGGFTDGELDAIEAAGGRVLVLGGTVLRTSSAGPAAIAVLNTALGRW